MQQTLAGSGVIRSDHPAKATPSPLTGKLFDGNGRRMTPSHTVKARRRYRYYVSQPLISGTADQVGDGWRLPAHEVETIVGRGLRDLLADRPGLTRIMRVGGLPPERLSAVFAAASAWIKRLDDEAGAVMTALVQRAELTEAGLLLIVSLLPLLPPGVILADVEALTVEHAVPVALRRRGCEMRLVVDGAGPPPRTDSALVKAIARARAWFDELANGTTATLAAIARREGVTDRYVAHLLPLAFLAPDIVGAILAGTHPVELTAETLIRHINLPADWDEQRRALGFH